ncbi:MAG: hypothetical protein HYU39_06830 [Thaumarchaeota archaeon]|nr:hypothetical protein [Nitrososphaerota archaeon]
MTIFGLSIQELVGIWGGILSTLLAVSKLLSYFFRQPRLTIKHAVNTAPKENPRYGFLDLIVQNTGWQTARCHIVATVKGSDFTEQELWWYDPKHKETKKEPYVTLYGKKATPRVINIFEINSTSNEVTITSKQEHSITLSTGKPYDFDFSVYSDPPAKARLCLHVEIKKWDNIVVVKLDC